MRMSYLWMGGAALLTLSVCRPLQAAPNLKVGSVTAKAGETITVPISVDPGASAIASLQFDLTLPAGLSTGTVTADPALSSSGKTVSAVLHDKDWRFIIFGVNQAPFAKGSLLTAQLTIAPGTAPGVLPLRVSHVVYSDAKGASIAPGKNASGKITVKKP